MKRIAMLFLVALTGVGCAAQLQPDRELKVLISVDMEGIAGVVTGEEVRRSGQDYELFRRIMTQETNAAVEGALAAGATEIVVRDAHGSARNILPDMLHPQAKLLRDWTGGALGMMEGIDETFGAVVFVGYHAKPGTPDAILQHTMSGVVEDISINGISMPESGINALIAGHYGVPVVFVAGDQACIDEVRELFGDIETVSVKQGIGHPRSAVLSLHPDESSRLIRAGVERAVRARHEYQPYHLEAPFTMVLKLRNQDLVDAGESYPGVTRTGERELTYTSDQIMDVIEAFTRLR